MSASYLRGVNLAGAEFGQTNLPGVFNTDYTFPSEDTFRYFCTRNLTLLRFPIQWERIQPALSGPLDTRYLSLVKQAVAQSKAHGGKLIIVVQNFGRYSIMENGQLNMYIIDDASSGEVRVTTADLANLWVRLSTEFKNEDGVYAYDLMNEPHDMGDGDWMAISQAVVDAIRAHADGKLLMIPGDNWSSASRWVSTHGADAWIQDPANNFLYEAHAYFDFNESGTYAMNYDAELQLNADLANVGVARLAPFVSWCRDNEVCGYVGEYGVPDTDPRWLTVLDNFLKALDAAGFDGTYWAAGEWWGDYALSVQPATNFSVDRVQIPVLLAHTSQLVATAAEQT
jgi:endoglucanase